MAMFLAKIKQTSTIIINEEIAKVSFNISELNEQDTLISPITIETDGINIKKLFNETSSKFIFNGTIEEFNEKIKVS